MVAVSGAVAAATLLAYARRRLPALAAESHAAREDYVAQYTPAIQRRRMSVLGCDTHLYYAGPEHPQRPPLLLIHGGIIEAATWLPTLAALATDRAVIAPDLPAHGLSGSLSPAQLLDWLITFVDQCGLEKFDLCGHSMGGALAFRYAAGRPDRIRRLILCAPVGLGSRFPHLWVRPAALLPLRRPSSLIIDNVWGDPNRLTSEQRWQFTLIIYDFFLTRRWQWFLSGGWRWVLELPSQVLAASLPPTLILWGERDHIIPFTARGARLLARHQPDVPMQFFPTVGHMPQLEAAEDFNSVVREFLS